MKRKRVSARSEPEIDIPARVESIGFRIRGNVQGVGFRWWARQTARALGLGGWVRNRQDGTVELHAHGPAAALDEFRAALRAGPPGSAVSAVEEFPIDPSSPYGEFEIHR